MRKELPDAPPSVFQSNVDNPMKTTLQPEVLQWARKRVGLSVETLAAKIGIKEDKVTDWEQTGELTLAQAEKLARVTYTPLGYLFLPEPPEEKLPVRDFRTLGTQSIQRPTPDLLDVVNEALLRQDWYHDYAIAAGEEPVAFVGSLVVSAGIAEAAAHIQSVIRWDAAMRAEAKTWEIALTQQIEAVEEAGILVMRSGIVGNNTHRPLSVSEFRGFALSDNYAPLIFLNGKDAKAAQMFTLAHEVAHIGLGISGVSNLRQTYAPNDQTERFCNAVAAELLVPAGELQAQWSQVRTTPDAVARLVRHFKVSSLVILRRLRDADFLTEAEFYARYSDELAQFSEVSAATGGGNFYRTLRTRLGRRFVSAMIESTLEGQTLYRDAFRLLGVSKADAVRKLATGNGGSRLMAHLIDASSLIEAKDRTFCFDICPGFWDWLDLRNTAGLIFSIDRILAELEAGDDELTQWAKQRRSSFFLPVDQATLTAVSQINTWVNQESFRPQAITDFMSGADPFLIAYALAHGHTVVTDETFVPGQKNRVKIPAVCQQFSVPYITPLEMLRSEGARFILQP